jgi:hypothetical protein
MMDLESLSQYPLLGIRMANRILSDHFDLPRKFLAARAFDLEKSLPTPNLIPTANPE